jgi:glycosyltransferase involved in cell wall biosynthesis
VLTGPFHYQTKSQPLDGVGVVGRAAGALSRPIPRWAFLQYLQKFAVPDPYVLRWLPLAVVHGRRIVQEKDFDAILSSSPVHTCHLVALALRRQTKKPWIADFRDPWVGNSGPLPRPAWADSLNERLEAMVVRRSTVITCASSAHLEQLRRRYPDCADKLVFLPNGFDPHDFLEVAPIRPADPVFNLIHAGHISRARRGLLSPLFEALTKLPTDICLQLIGAKGAEVDDLIRHFGLDVRVTTTTELPHKVALGWCRGADLLILIQGALSSIPGKLYEYVAAGRPILHIGPESCAVGKLLAEWGVGRTAQSVEEIISAILQARRDNSNGSSLYRMDLGRYSRQQLTAELAGHLDQLTRSKFDSP